MHEGNAGVGVPEIVRPDIAQDRLPLRTSRQKPVISDRCFKFPQREGKTHALFLGNRSRTSRAADESQTVRGPVLAIPKEELAFPVIPPFEGQQFASCGTPSVTAAG